MVELQHYSETIILSEGFVARLGAAATPERLAHCRDRTLAMLTYMRNERHISSSEDLKWIEEVKSQQIDPDARVGDMTMMHATPRLPFNSERLLSRLVRQGQAAPALFAALLDAADEPMGDPKDNPFYQLYNRECEERCPYWKQIVSHPRMDVNALADERFTLFSLCMQSALRCVCGPSHKTNRDYSPHEQRLARLVPALMERGAIPSWVYYTTPIYQHVVNSSLFKPYYERWEQEWQQWQDGTLTPDQIGPEHLRHFYSLKKLPECLGDYKRWKGHEARALAMYAHLPEWLQATKCGAGECQMLASLIRPEPLVESWSIDLAVRPPQPQTLTKP